VGKHFFCTAQDPAKITLLSWTDKAHRERERETHRKRGSQKEGATWREREIKEAKREYQREEEAERKRETFFTWRDDDARRSPSGEVN
jgi:hypothetical protein